MIAFLNDSLYSETDSLELEKSFTNSLVVEGSWVLNPIICNVPNSLAAPVLWLPFS